MDHDSANNANYFTTVTMSRDSHEATIKYKCEHFSWAWILTPHHFEIMHELRRLVQLLPDKLVSVIAINQFKDGTPDGGVDSGAFILTMVINQVSIYRRHLERHTANVSPNTRTVFSLGADVFEDAEEELNGPRIIGHLIDQATILKDILVTHDLAIIKCVCMDLLRLCDSLLTCCTIFLHMIHPTWVDLNRNMIQDMTVREHHVAAILYLDRDRLVKEFSQILHDEGFHS